MVTATKADLYCIDAGLAWLILDSLGWRSLTGLSSLPLGVVILPPFCTKQCGGSRWHMDIAKSARPLALLMGWQGLFVLSPPHFWCDYTAAVGK